MLELEADFKGRKPFNCDIILDAALVMEETRWSTLIHEGLHTLSAGYIGVDYRDFRGYEEGVVERLQRLLRPWVLERLGVVVPAESFLPDEEKHRYNVYIAALEEICRALAVEETPAARETFYRDLLAIPIRSRSVYLLGLGFRLPEEKRKDFLVTYSAANAVLTRSRA